MAIRNGTNSNDIIQATNYNDHISGLEGHDLLRGLWGNDHIIGDGGHDTLDGGSGNDLLYGKTGDDLLDGGNGDDVLMGGQGHDLLDGGDGDDLLNGKADNDKLIGGKGNDTLTGGSGADKFIFDGDIFNGFDTITDFNPAQGDQIILDNIDSYWMGQTVGQPGIAVSFYEGTDYGSREWVGTFSVLGDISSSAVKNAIVLT